MVEKWSCLSTPPAESQKVPSPGSPFSTQCLRASCQSQAAWSRLAGINVHIHPLSPGCASGLTVTTLKCQSFSLLPRGTIPFFVVVFFLKTPILGDFTLYFSYNTPVCSIFVCDLHFHYNNVENIDEHHHRATNPFYTLFMDYLSRAWRQLTAFLLAKVVARNFGIKLWVPIPAPRS